jgi:hypothetical protein
LLADGIHKGEVFEKLIADLSCRVHQQRQTRPEGGSQLWLASPSATPCGALLVVYAHWPASRASLISPEMLRARGGKNLLQAAGISTMLLPGIPLAHSASIYLESLKGETSLSSPYSDLVLSSENSIG